MENQTNTNGQNIILSESMIYNLRKAAPWMKFLAILSYIASGVLIIGAIIVIQQSSGMSYYYNSSGITFAAIIYIVMAIIMIVIATYLFKSADGYSKYSLTKDSSALENAFLMQKKYWQTVGVFTIVMLSLTVIALLIGIGVAASRW